MYQRIVIYFKGVEDVINHRRPLRTFSSPMFEAGDHFDKALAIQKLVEAYRKEGFTIKEVIKERVINIPVPT